MLTQKIRRAFLEFFKRRGHVIVSSSPVIPHEDPTLLFINAGMNQFKDVFLGASLREYSRAATSQKCIRVGGKHNDLENVGHTSRHLTFFEMLGNFSFGDYFKEQAIQFSWEVATEVFQLNPERIWPTVYLEDGEAFELWKKYVPEKRITRCGEKDNFWAMGDTGPCGPCSELLYDRGEPFGRGKSPLEDPSGERFLEFWNLVFMQFNRNSEGKMEVLPKPSIDTGAGLERIVSLKMEVESVFETDVLRSLIAQVEEVAKVTYSLDDRIRAPAFRVIADHLRSLAFAIADGAQPSNVDRGYVLRKVLRRAVRYGRMLGLEEPFLAKVFPRLIDTMGADYPELIQARQRIVEILTQEEEAFLRTLKRGGNLLYQIVEKAKQQGGCIAGEDAFKLKDTYGLPFEEISLLAKDAGLSVDEGRYHALEGEAKERSRTVHKKAQQVASPSLFEPFFHEKGATRFLGYTEYSGEGIVLALMQDGAFVDSLEEGAEGIVLLDQSPFYAEMGGQVGDRGLLTSLKAKFSVSDTRAPFKGLIGHVGKMEKGVLRLGDKVLAHIDEKRREKIANNHTATHLLHWALQKVLGEHIKQAGSVVDSERLRFDFSHHKGLSVEEIAQVEDLVNERIRSNHPVRWYEMPYEEAKDRTDIKQFFGEKYGAKVRVVETHPSKELCGGTHTSLLGNIGYFRISKESSIAAGVRRIEAVTGVEAEELGRQSDALSRDLALRLKVSEGKLRERVDQLIEENKALLEHLKKLREQELLVLQKALLEEKEEVLGIPYIAKEVALNTEELRSLAEGLLTSLKRGAILLGSNYGGKASLYLRLSADLVQKGLAANAIIRDLAPLIEGSGGGKQDSATAGGKAPEKIPLALLKLRDYLF